MGILNRGTAVITGASSGLGELYAEQLAFRGKHSLILVARRTERLEAVKKKIFQIWGENPANLKAEVVTCDLSLHQDRVALATKLREDIDLDLLVNNAGFGSVGRFCAQDLGRQIDMVRVNSIAPLHLSRECLPGMKQRGGGAIINVCSTGGFQPLSYMATYGATKAFLVSFSFALAAEHYKDNITVLAHCPGPTRTEFHIAAGIENKIKYIPAMSAQKVVEEALCALDKKRSLCVNGLVNKLSVALRVLPPYLRARIAERFLRKYA